MVAQLASILNFDLDEMMEKIMLSNQSSRQLLAMLKALDDLEDNDSNSTKNVIESAAA